MTLLIGQSNGEDSKTMMAGSMRETCGESTMILGVCIVSNGKRIEMTAKG